MKNSVKEYVSFLVSQQPIYDKEILKSIGPVERRKFSYSRKKRAEWESNLKRFKKQLNKRYPEIRSNRWRKGVRTRALNRWLNSNEQPPSSRKEAKIWSNGGYFITEPWEPYEGAEHVFDKVAHVFPKICGEWKTGKSSDVGEPIDP